VGIGGKGNEGVTGQIKQSPGSIGYVELIFAKNNSLPVAELRNKAGHFVSPSLEATTEAANGSLKTMPNDFRVSITNAEGAKSYPISGFTYLLVYQNPSDATKGAELVKFLNWAVTEGQSFASDLHYAPLPKSLVTKIQSKIKTLSTAKQSSKTS
jgi:phosphate transport system substrate-binding protein